LSINTFKHKNPSQNQNNLLDATIDATVKFLVTLAETSNLPVFVAVRKTNGEFTVFSRGFRVTRKNRVAEGVVF
jgi:hypothetical protein